MPLSPDLQDFLDQFTVYKQKLLARGFKPNQTNTREAMANASQLYVTDYDRDMLTVDDTVDMDGYPIPIRVYLPATDKALPLAVFIHGGGHMCGSITTYDGICRKLAEACQHIIVAIDYRLAPEFKYPVGLNDCRAAIRGLATILAERGIQLARTDITLIGDSGGGALCATLSSDEDFVQEVNIRQQVLFYPGMDYTLSSDSMQRLGEGYYLERNKIKWFYDNYFPSGADRKVASPLYAGFYATMPRTLILLAEYDPVIDEGLAYFQQLQDNGIESNCHIIPGVIHAYISFENLCRDACEQSYELVAEFLN